MKWLWLLLILPMTCLAQRPVVLLTDLGMDIDDQWALAHLVSSPRVRLLGVVTSHAANLPAPAAEVTARATRDALRRLGVRRFVPVLPGASAKLAGRDRPRHAPGVEFLLALSRRHERLAVLVIGPATDLASALLIDPALAGRIEVIAMAFKRWPGVGSSWNVRQDVAAWQVVLASPVPLTIGSDQVCVRDLSITGAQARAAVGAAGTGGRYLAELTRTHIAHEGPREARRLSGRPDAWVIWDEIAVAHLLGFTRVLECTRPPLGDDQVFTPRLAPGRGMGWIAHVDRRALLADLAACLTRPPRQLRCFEDGSW